MKKENKWIKCIKEFESDDERYYVDGQGGFFEKRRWENYLLRYNGKGEVLKKLDFNLQDGIDSRILVYNNKLYIQSYKIISKELDLVKNKIYCTDYEGNILYEIEDQRGDLTVLDNGDIDIVIAEQHCIVTEELNKKICIRGMKRAVPSFLGDKMIFLKDVNELIIVDSKGENLQEIKGKDKNIRKVVTGNNNNCYLIIVCEEKKKDILEIWEKTEGECEKIIVYDDYKGWVGECYLEGKENLYVEDQDGFLKINLCNRSIDRIPMKGNFSEKGIRGESGNYYFLVNNYIYEIS